MNSHRNPGETSTVVSFRGSGRPRAFTIIELLVVLTIMALLAAVLAPAVQRAGRHAKAIACQSQLGQWGLGFSALLGEGDASVHYIDSDAWQALWRPYCDGGKGSFLCPMATRYELNQNDPDWTAQVAMDCDRGSKFTAWKLATRTPSTLEPGPLFGSYGVNSLGLVYADDRTIRGHQTDRSTRPVFLDCAFYGMQVQSSDRPPSFDGELVVLADIKYCCIDRHGGGINGLFADWSVRRVGLKELWTLSWSPWFDPHGPWTRAGGVGPEDWPAWMRGFKDY